MSELQPGMLALTLNSWEGWPMVGCVVEVVDVVGAGTIGSDGKTSRPYEFDGFVCENAGKRFGYYREHLLPLPPLADPLEVTHKEELHA